MRNKAFTPLLCAGIACWLAACSAVPLETERQGLPQAQAPAASLYVLRRGRHTDLVLPVEQLRAPLSGLTADFPEARYLVFGFGDRQYVLATHRNLAHTLLAPLPGAGLILVSGLKDRPANVYGADHLVALEVEPGQIEAIDRFIWESLEQDPPGAVSPYMPGKYPGNVYYGSTRTYYGLYTCNTWTADALKIGGLPVRSIGVVFAGQVWEQVQALARDADSRNEMPNMLRGIDVPAFVTEAQTAKP